MHSQLAMRKNTAGERRASVGPRSALGEYTSLASGNRQAYLPDELNHVRGKMEPGLFDNGEA